MSEEKRILQEELYNIIDIFFKSGIKSDKFNIAVQYDSLGEHNYFVKFINNNSISTFTTSSGYGVWGINEEVDVETINDIAKQEIRNAKLEHLLDNNKNVL